MTAPDDLAALRAEIAQLRQATDRLRRELNDLHRFITVEHDDDGNATNICVRCAILTLSRPDAADRFQIFITAGPGDTGPCISMLGSDGKPRILLTLEKDDPCITLRAPGGTDAVLLRADAATGRGLVGALDNGKSRAILQAVEGDAGAVAVVHDDGRPRVCLRSTATDGEIFVSTRDLKTAIKLTTNSQYGGGTLIVHSHSGKPAVILSTLAGYGGAIILNDPEGIPYVTLPDPKTQADAEDDAD